VCVFFFFFFGFGGVFCFFFFFFFFLWQFINIHWGYESVVYTNSIEQLQVETRIYTKSSKSSR